MKYYRIVEVPNLDPYTLDQHPLKFLIQYKLLGMWWTEDYHFSLSVAESLLKKKLDMIKYLKDAKTRKPKIVAEYNI